MVCGGFHKNFLAMCVFVCVMEHRSEGSLDSPVLFLLFLVSIGTFLNQVVGWFLLALGALLFKNRLDIEHVLHDILKIQGFVYIIFQDILYF